METEKLLKEHVVDIRFECPICYDFKQLQYKCEACKWESCIECSDTWRKISNTCPQCRMELEDLEEEEKEKCPVVRFMVKVAAIIFCLYICFAFAVINAVFNCAEDNVWCILSSLIIYLVIIYFAVSIVKKILER